MTKVTEEINRINFQIDDKVQLMCILISLSDESLYEQYKNMFNFHEGNNLYFEEMKSKFSYLYKTNILDKFNYIKNTYNLHYQNAIEYVICLDDNFNFKDNTSEFFLKDEIIEFNKDLKILYNSKEFKDFFNSHMNEYQTWIDSVKKDFLQYDVITAIEEYCGISNKKYYVDFISCETSGGYSIYLDNETHFCFRVKTSCMDNNYYHVNDSKNNIPVCVHEFIHGIVNPITLKDNIFTFESNYFEHQPEKGYGNDFTIFNEYIVRAITARLVNKVTGVDTDKLISEGKIEKDFPLMQQVVGLLKEYENNRDKYSNIELYFNSLNIFFLENLNKKEK